MIKLREDNSINSSDGAVLNDKAPDSTCATSLKLHKAFPYIKEYARPDCEEICSFNQKTLIVTIECIPVIGGVRGKRHNLTFQPLQDYSTESDRVKTFCGIVFDAEVKAAYIASLPTVDEPVMSKRQVTVDLPVMINNPDYDAEVEGSQQQIQKTEVVLVDVEETTVLDGAVQKVVKAHQAKQEQGAVETIGVTDESGAKVMEEYDTGEVVTKIQYKGELYKNAAELLAL